MEITQTVNTYQKYFVPFNPFILEQIHITGAAAFPAAIIQLSLDINYSSFKVA